MADNARLVAEKALVEISGKGTLAVGWLEPLEGVKRRRVPGREGDDLGVTVRRGREGLAEYHFNPHGCLFGGAPEFRF